MMRWTCASPDAHSLHGIDGTLLGMVSRHPSGLWSAGTTQRTSHDGKPDVFDTLDEAKDWVERMQA